jgi:hypothetical protein
MRSRQWLAAISALKWSAMATAQDIAYVTELELYSQLAPCAAYGLWANMYSVTQSAASCGADETSLQSCVCSNTAERSSFASEMSSSVAYSCGSTATDDMSSASRVLDKYCNPSSVITFATPTTNVVNAFITDLSETAWLPPCARTALSYAVMGMVCA